MREVTRHNSLWVKQTMTTLVKVEVVMMAQLHLQIMICSEIVDLQNELNSKTK